MDRDDERRPLGWQRDRRGVDDVDGTGGLLHRRPAKAVPGLVEGEARQGQVPNRDRRHEARRRRVLVAGGDADEVEVRVLPEGAEQAEDGGGRPTGDAVPTLLDGHGDPKALAHGQPVWTVSDRPPPIGSGPDARSRAALTSRYDAPAGRDVARTDEGARLLTDTGTGRRFTVAS